MTRTKDLQKYLAGALGPWQITDTVVSTRKNLFCMSETKGHHIATIVSGSRSQITRFEESLALIRSAPELYQLLAETLVAIRETGADGSSSLGELASNIEAALARVSSSSSES